MKDRALAKCDNLNAYYADQFASPDVTAGYEPMGQEIIGTLGRDVDLFCAAVGTGGTLMGAWRGMVKSGSYPRVIAFEPEQSPFLSTGKGVRIKLKV